MRRQQTREAQACRDKKQRATGEQIRRLVREESDRSDPIAVAKALINEHPELAVSSFRWLVRQVAWALALERMRDDGVTPQSLKQDPPTASKRRGRRLNAPPTSPIKRRLHHV